MAEKNFSLIVVAIVAIVGIVGLLNMNGMTGMNPTNVVQTATEEELYFSEIDCRECDRDVSTGQMKEETCKYECSSYITEVGSGYTGRVKCGTLADGSDKWCYKRYYR